MSQKLKFSRTSESLFFATVRHRVSLFFKSHQLSQHANKKMWFKVVFFLTGFVGLYTLILSGFAAIWMLLPLTATLGIFCAFVGFNVCHDALHGSLSENNSVNNLFGFLFHLIGANPY
ncbi:MAG: acyl-CoA desaturase, partial [Pedobacter sp.]